jgi:hypothetical protein
VVMIAFLSLITLTAYPLHAQQEAPGAVETAGKTATHSGGSSILPIILIVVGVGAIAAVLFLVILKSYDIRGTWSVQYQFTAGSSSAGTLTIVFVGTTKDSGTLTDSYNDTGSWTASGKDVTWTLTSYSPQFVWTGTFSATDTMSGTMNDAAHGDSGTWTATRTAAAATAPNATATAPWKNR